MRHKGKVYPTTPPPSASTFPVCSGDILKLFPATILTLTSVLSLEEREVLAYMITSSIKSINNNNPLSENKKKTSNTNTHKTTPMFECQCFDCYTSYWFKWDSSPNRELIHQAIEAFEDHLNTTQPTKKKSKKRDKLGHNRLAGKPLIPSPENQEAHPPPVFEASLVETDDDPVQDFQKGVEKESELPETTVVSPAAVAVPASLHKGLTRTVLPDVMGLLNSRFWSLWSPNV